MSIAEKLTQIAENEQKVFEAGKSEGKAEIYKYITITQDCTNIKTCYDVLTATNVGSEKMVLFVNKKWNTRPDSTFANNTLLYLLWYAEDFIPNGKAERSATWLRWRDNDYNYNNVVYNEYDANISTGDEFIRMVIL
jgi:hypothetical protein